MAATLVDVAGAADARESFGLEKRVPWTASRVIGSPEPRLPFTVEPIFTNVEWRRPIYAKAEPGTESLLVVEQGGERETPSRVWRLRDAPETAERELLLELRGRLIYGLEFAPGYDAGGHLYVFNNGPTGESARTNHISRFTVSPGPGHGCDLDSEEVIIEWASAGHDGGDLVFGQDGMLYITSGDGTSDSDGLLSGQDVRNLLGGVLRIDVTPDNGAERYSVPEDNPFLQVPGARGELWAFGLRNPWRMTMDRKTGRIWVGNNGQDLWETVHLLKRGENYGWSVYEGSHPFYLNRQRGPAPIVAPTVEHSHSEYRSLTGGVVYYGPALPELEGLYVYGDYSTGKINGARHDGQRLREQLELADTALQIAAFAVSPRGDLLAVDLGGGLYRLVRQVADDRHLEFPRRLSETGLFASTPEHRVETGVMSYSVNAPSWVDGATVERFMAVPGEHRVDYTSSGSWGFPDGTVLMQTLRWAPSPEGVEGGRRVETRLLTRQDGEWVGYSYRWNSEQDDAVLVAREGGEVQLEPADGEDGNSHPTWRFPSQAECMACHSRAANFVLGVSEMQLNRGHDYDGKRDNQLRTLAHIGFFRGRPPKPEGELSRLADPYDLGADPAERARAYLHVNCSPCHVEAGGGNSRIDLRHGTPLKRMNLVSVPPQHDTFALPRAMLVAPGEPERSVLYARVSRRGRGQMPPLGTSRVDERAVRLLGEWIGSLTPDRTFVRAWTVEDLLPWAEGVRRGRSFVAGETAFGDLGCAQCHRFLGKGGGAGPDLAGLSQRLTIPQILEAIVSPSKQVLPDYATTVLELKDGAIVEGRVEREDATAVVVRTAGSFDEALRVPKASIRERRLSTQSAMPAGLLDYLERDQVLDLLAYLYWEGNANHAAFGE